MSKVSNFTSHHCDNSLAYGIGQALMNRFLELIIALDSSLVTSIKDHPIIAKYGKSSLTEIISMETIVVCIVSTAKVPNTMQCSQYQLSSCIKST